MNTPLLCLLAATVVPVLCHGQLLCYESFTGYVAGAQIEDGPNGSPGTAADGGLGWTGAWDVNNALKSLVRSENRTASPVDYSAGSVLLRGGDRALRLYDNANGSYVIARKLALPLTASDSRGIWLSFLFRTNNASPLANQDFLQVGLDDATGAAAGNPRLSAGVNTVATTFTTPQAFQFFARCGTAPAGSVFSGTNVAAAATSLVVVQFQSSGPEFDRASLYLNPEHLHAPGLPVAIASLPTGITVCTDLIIRTSALDAGDAYVIDEVRIGRDYRSVVDRLAPELAPVLFFDPSGHLILRWPQQPATIMETSQSFAADDWQPLAGSPAVLSGYWQQILPAATERAFFRLSK